MSDTEDQLGPLRETVPIGIPSKAQSGRDRSTRCVGVWPYSFRSTTAHTRPQGSRSLHPGQLHITGRMFMNQWADLRRDSPACLPVALTFSFFAATPIFHQMHLPLLLSVLPCCHPPSAQRPRSQNQSTTPFPPRPSRRPQSSMYPSTPHV
jgi:hypothetical protein